MLKETKKFIGNKNIIISFRIQAHDSIICGYFCIWFIYFMSKGGKLLEYTNSFSPSVYEKNDKVIQTFFKKKLKWKESTVLFEINIKNLKD